MAVHYRRAEREITPCCADAAGLQGRRKDAQAVEWKITHVRIIITFSADLIIASKTVPKYFGAMQTLADLALLIAVPTVTPGPNNFIIMTESAAGGIRRAFLPILAIAVGSALMLAAVTELLAFQFMQRLLPLLGIAGALALSGRAIQQWILARRPLQQIFEAGRAAALAPLQWTNPKAWALVAAVAAAGSASRLSGWIPIALLALISIVSSLLWATAGRRLSDHLAHPAYGPWIRRAMAASLLLAAVQLFISQIGDQR
jgi:threonine/homoserine/homoserine lactone efflux protein